MKYKEILIAGFNIPHPCPCVAENTPASVNESTLYELIPVMIVMKLLLRRPDDERAGNITEQQIKGPHLKLPKTVEAA